MEDIYLSLDELKNIINEYGKDIDLCAIFNTYMETNQTVDINYVVENLHFIDFENTNKEDIQNLFRNIAGISINNPTISKNFFDISFKLYDEGVMTKDFLIDCLEAHLKEDASFKIVCDFSMLLSLTGDLKLPEVVNTFIDKGIFEKDDFLVYMEDVSFKNSQKDIQGLSKGHFFSAPTYFSLSQIIKEEETKRFLLNPNTTEEEIKNLISDLSPGKLVSIRIINNFINSIDTSINEQMERYNLVVDSIIENNPDLLSSMTTRCLTFEQMDKIISLDNPNFFEEMINSEPFESLEMSDKLRYVKAILETSLDDSNWGKDEKFLISASKNNLASSIKKALDLDIPSKMSSNKSLVSIKDAIEQMDNGFGK